VNHVAVETAQEALDVVFGMFLVNSALASVLFDSGASHSYISAQFVAKYGILVHSMSSHMLVSSPGGNKKAMDQCLDVGFKIVGREFCANFVVLDSKGIDIILLTRLMQLFSVPKGQCSSQAQKVNDLSLLQHFRW
jgi:hypothetical protein